MGLYNVVQPCVIVSGGKAVHHVRPTSQPIDVDDEVAAELVESGQLERYAPGEDGVLVAPASGLSIGLIDDPEVAMPEPEPESERPKPRRGKASSES